MTKFDEMFAEYIKKQSKSDPDVFTAILPDDSRVEIRAPRFPDCLVEIRAPRFPDCLVEIHGPQVPYSQEVDWEGVYPDPKNIRRNNDEHH